MMSEERVLFDIEGLLSTYALNENNVGLGSRHPFSYFMDVDGTMPPSLEPYSQQKYYREITYPRNLRVSKWSPIERTQLSRGVRQMNQKLLVDRLMEEFKGEFQSYEFRQRLKTIQNLPDVELEYNLEGLDWSQISSVYLPSRTSSECYIQWTVHDHPSLNRNEWNKNEISRLSALISSMGSYDWPRIATEFGDGRSPADCFIQYQRRLNSSMMTKSKWTQSEDDILRKTVAYWGEGHWQDVAESLEGRTGQQCLHRWLKSIGPHIHRGKWTPEEDAVLSSAVALYGTSKWTCVSKLVKGRTDVQCRERYMNVLKPGLDQGPWTVEEDAQLTSLVAYYGQGKWSLIASNLPTRTDNQCWRRWKSIQSLKKRPSLSVSLETDAEDDMRDSSEMVTTTTEWTEANDFEHTTPSLHTSTESLNESRLSLSETLSSKPQTMSSDHPMLGSSTSPIPYHWQHIPKRRLTSILDQLKIYPPSMAAPSHSFTNSTIPSARERRSVKSLDSASLSLYSPLFQSIEGNHIENMSVHLEPFALDAYNTEALLRLWKKLKDMNIYTDFFLDLDLECSWQPSLLDSSCNTLSDVFDEENALIEVKNSFDYQQLYARFESLFLWPFLLALSGTPNDT